MTTLSIPCPATTLPTQAELTNLFVGIAQLPSKLILMASNEFYAERDQLIAAAMEIKKLLAGVSKTIENVVGDITNPLFIDFRIPELEWQQKIESLLNNFHSFILNKLITLISALIPLNLNITILGITVDLVAFFSSPTNVFASIKQQISSKIDTFYNMLPDAYKLFGGLFGFEIPTFKMQSVIDYFMSMLNKGLIGILHSALTALINKFKSIWDTLGLPMIAALLTFDVDSFIAGLIASAKGNAAKALENLKNVTLFGFSVNSIIGGSINTLIQNSEMELRRIIRALRDFANNWQKKLILDWMQVVTSFLNAIGLSSLLSWVVFTFCSFLQLIGFPSSINIPNGIDINSL